VRTLSTRAAMVRSVSGVPSESRVSVWDDFAPRDFVVGKWPYGKVRPPPKFARQFGSSEELAFQMEGIRELQRVVREFYDYMDNRKWTQRVAARKLHVNRNALSRLLRGVVFSDTTTLIAVWGAVEGAARDAAAAKQAAQEAAAAKR